MAVYTELSQPFIEELANEYDFGRVAKVVGIPEGSVNSNYVIEAARGRFLVRVDEVKSESEVDAKSICWAFCANTPFHVPHPLQDRMGRFYRDYETKCASAVPLSRGASSTAATSATEPARDHRPRRSPIFT